MVRKTLPLAHQELPSSGCGVGFQTATVRFGGTSGPTSSSPQLHEGEMHSGWSTSSPGVMTSKRTRVLPWDAPPVCRDRLRAARCSDADRRRTNSGGAETDL